MMAPAGKRARTAEGDPTRSFFERLAERGHERMGERGHERLLESASGTLRFDLTDGGEEHWFVTLDKGDVTVSHGRAAADVEVRASRSLFDDVVSGKVNATAAVLRGELVADGDPGLLFVFQRLFPAPPRSRAARRAGREGRPS
jgi:putative sterol carrier protein